MVSDQAGNAGSNQRLVVGVGVGAVLAFCIALLMYLVRKNPLKAKRILVGMHA